MYIMFNMVRERRLIQLNSQEFYVTRNTPKVAESVAKNPMAVLGVMADVAHRVFKLTSDGLRLLQGKDRGELPSLNDGEAVRTTESTIGAIGGVIGGIGNTIRGKLIAGPAKFLQGVVDAGDALISAPADLTTSTTGLAYNN